MLEVREAGRRGSCLASDALGMGLAVLTAPSPRFLSEKKQEDCRKRLIECKTIFVYLLYS